MRPFAAVAVNVAGTLGATAAPTTAPVRTGGELPSVRMPVPWRLATSKNRLLAVITPDRVRLLALMMVRSPAPAFTGPVTFKALLFARMKLPVAVNGPNVLNAFPAAPRVTAPPPPVRVRPPLARFVIDDAVSVIAPCASKSMAETFVKDKAPPAPAVSPRFMVDALGPKMLVNGLVV